MGVGYAQNANLPTVGQEQPADIYYYSPLHHCCACNSDSSHDFVQEIFIPQHHCCRGKRSSQYSMISLASCSGKNLLQPLVQLSLNLS